MHHSFPSACCHAPLKRVLEEGTICHWQGCFQRYTFMPIMAPFVQAMCMAHASLGSVGLLRDGESRVCGALGVGCNVCLGVGLLGNCCLGVGLHSNACMPMQCNMPQHHATA